MIVKSRNLLWGYARAIYSVHGTIDLQVKVGRLGMLGVTDIQLNLVYSVIEVYIVCDISDICINQW